jgi:hypothetical protein
MLLWVVVALGADCDLDGLDDALELGCAAGSTDPAKADSDGGGEVDGAELAHGGDPCDPSDDSSPGDADRDKVPDDVEWVLGTDWTQSDTDGDGALDLFELYGIDRAPCTGDETDPNDPDTDGDGLIDGEDIYPTEGAWPGSSADAPDPTGCDLVLVDGRDPEFDELSEQVAWQEVDTDGSQQLVLARVDHATGAFVDPRVIDDNLLPPRFASNGAEWLVDGETSVVLYAKPDGWGRTNIWHARPDGAGGFVTAMLPTAPEGVGPFGTQRAHHPGPSFVRWSVADPLLFRVNYVAPYDAPEQAYAYGSALTSHRFASGMSAIVLTLEDPMTGHTQVYQHQPQLTPPAIPGFTRITDDRVDKQGAFSWEDPTLGQLVMTTHHNAVGDPYLIAVYAVDTGALVTQIPSPPALPFVVSPEPFVWDGVSYVSWEAALGQPVKGRAEHGHTLGSRDGVAQVWIAAVGTGERTGLARRLTHIPVPEPQLDLKDPEPYMAAAKPWVYHTVDTPGVLEVYRCETGL